MVKLIFKPTLNIGESNDSLRSKTSKKKEINYNPFAEYQSVEPIELVEPIEPVKSSKTIPVGLENCHYVIKEWYYQKSTGTGIKEPLLIIGPVGCGKTSLIDYFCESEEIIVLNIKSTEIVKTKKELINEIFLFCEYSTNFFVKTFKKKLIFIDEYQNSQNDILSLTDINNLVKKLEPGFEKINLPGIIIISSDSKGSKLSELKKTSQVYYINEIPTSILKNWLSNELKLENDFINQLIKYCKSDKRLILNTINFKNNNCNLNNNYKDSDLNIFDFLEELFNNKPSLNDIFKTYENDGYTIANLIQENYLDYRGPSHANLVLPSPASPASPANLEGASPASNDMDLIAKVAESISLGETIYSDTFENNRTFLPNFHCLCSLVIPSFLCQTDIPNKGLRSSIINNKFNILLNNKKIIAKINEFEPRPMDIYDIYSIKSILTQEVIKSKVKNDSKINFLKNVMNTFTGDQMNKLELVYKHFYDFKEHPLKEIKTKNFTLKFKDKLK